GAWVRATYQERNNGRTMDVWGDISERTILDVRLTDRLPQGLQLDEGEDTGVPVEVRVWFALIRCGCSRWEDGMGIVVGVKGQADLPQVIGTGCPGRGIANALHGR